MPIDPRLVLGLQPLQLNDPLETAGKAIGLRNALAHGRAQEQEAAINSEQLKSAQLKNQETERGISEEKVLSGIWNEAGGDLGKTRELAAQRGVNPKIVMQLDKEITEHATRLSQEEITKFNARKARNQAAYDTLAPVVAAEADPMQQKALWNQAIPALIEAGAIQKEHVQEYPGPQGVRHAMATVTTADQITKAEEEIRKQAAEKRAIEEDRRKADAAAADLTLKNLKITGQEPIQPADVAREADAAAQRKLTERGQNMTDARGRELAQATREAAVQAREDKPPTSAQSTVASYAERIHQATRALDSLTQGTGERIYNRIAPNFFQTEKGQAFDQAERNFINAVLRRESGAVISPSEFVEARKQYIPQPGDEPTVLKLKAEARKTVKDSFIKAAGKAYSDPDGIQVEEWTRDKDGKLVKK